MIYSACWVKTPVHFRIRFYDYAGNNKVWWRVLPHIQMTSDGSVNAGDGHRWWAHYNRLADTSKNKENAEFNSVQFLDRLGRWGDMKDNSAEILSQFFSAGGPCVQFWHGRGSLLVDVVHLAFPWPTTASPPPSKVPWRVVLDRLAWRMTCSNQNTELVAYCSLR